MQWDFLLLKFGGAFLLPPGLQLCLIVLAIVIGRRWRQLGVALFCVSLISLYLLATPFVAEGLMARWQQNDALQLALLPHDETNAAIVVLGGGRDDSAPEFDGIDTVNALTLQRLRYASRLQKQTHLPLLLSGGKAFGEPTPEAVLMNDSFIADLRGAPNWLETSSRNTAENASQSAIILRDKNIAKIYLVTHAWHMARARYLFEQQGLEVVPAPMGFVRPSSGHPGPLDFAPSAQALLQSSWYFKERLATLFQ